MNAEEINALIQNGKNSGIEFKQDDVRPEQLGKELVAFFNFRGGKILLGVEELECEINGKNTLTNAFKNIIGA